MNKRLTQFDENYYEYPTSIGRGYWATYPISNDLSDFENERRDKWLGNVKRKANNKFNQFIFSKFSKEYSIPDGILEEHGLFLERFYQNQIKNEVIKDITADTDVFENLYELIKEDSYYKHVSNDKHDLLFHVVDNLYEQKILQVINNAGKYQLLVDWYLKYSEKIICEICGNNFRVVDIPDWAYFASNGIKNCCLRCEILDKPKKKELHDHIPEFIKGCGFIPKSISHPQDYAFSSRFTQTEWIEIIKLYGKMGGIEHVKKSLAPGLRLWLKQRQSQMVLKSQLVAFGV